MKKKYDLAVKTGSYTGNDGKEKGNWKNVGAVMQNNNGFFMILDRTFNPAGVPNPENKESVLVSMFEPRDNNQQQTPQQSQAPAQGFDDDFNDDIPF